MNDDDKTGHTVIANIVSLSLEERQASGLEHIDMTQVASATFDDRRLATVTLKNGTVVKLGNESSANFRRANPNLKLI